MIHTFVDSPVGPLRLSGDGHGLSGLSFAGGRGTSGGSTSREDHAFPHAREQLEQYFRGERREFDLALLLSGSPFELRVWAALRKIPFGETTSYGELAASLGDRSAARAVGLANGRNPIAVIVPCHRVIGADGSLTGFGGGLERKRFLLDLEAGVQSLLAAPGLLAS
jgi:methylated-DNA-[protein]-cysteine S-methyltransferase